MRRRVRVGEGFTMEPYDPNRRCPKCGGEEVGVEFHGSLHDSSACVAECGFGRFSDECRTFEHFDRTCRRCGYSWIEGLPAMTKFVEEAIANG